MKLNEVDSTNLDWFNNLFGQKVSGEVGKIYFKSSFQRSPAAWDSR